jgi:hypothetical protein
MGKIIFNDTEVNDIITKYTKDLMSITEIGKIYSRDGGTITRVLTENNIKLAKGSAFNVKYWMERGLNEVDANYKVKTLKPSLKEYWIHRGYSEDDAVLQTELHLMNTERAFVLKYGENEGKKKFNEKKTKEGKFNSQRSIDYWISRGYNEADAKLKIKEKQTTFTLDKCIDKYGVDVGTKKFKDRQNNWVKKLNDRADIDEINKKKTSKSLDIIMKKNPDNYIDVYFNFNIKNKSLEVLLNPTKTNNYVEFLNTVKNNFIFNSKVLKSIAQIKLFHFVFTKTFDEIYNDLKKIYGYRKTNTQIYGNIFVLDGYIFRSLGEKIIYEKLKDLNIKFNYDKFYPEQKNFKYDFYLIDYDIYIEYFGMLKVKTTSKNENILRNYKIKCEKKLELCLNNNYKFIFSGDENEIVEKINKLYDDKKNNN